MVMPLCGPSLPRCADTGRCFADGLHGVEAEVEGAGASEPQGPGSDVGGSVSVLSALRVEEEPLLELHVAHSIPDGRR